MFDNVEENKIGIQSLQFCLNDVIVGGENGDIYRIGIIND